MIVLFSEDIIIFTHDRHLDTAVRSMNNTLESLNEAMTPPSSLSHTTNVKQLFFLGAALINAPT